MSEPDELDETTKGLAEQLKSLRYQPAPERWQQLARQPQRRPLRLLVIAAAVVAVAAAGVAAMQGPIAVVPEATLPVVVASSKATRETTLTTTRWLETSAEETATVTMPELGTVRLQPGSKLRLSATGDGPRQRLELARGSLRASVSAPPRLFVVDTPHATAVDLGCVYTLDVADAEHTVLTVELGVVALEGGGQVSNVIAGMRAASARGQPPGVPLSLSAPEPLRTAVEGVAEGEFAALGAGLAGARHEDAATLWHLLARVPAAQQPQVVERLSALVPAPKSFTLAAAADQSSDPMSEWWKAILDSY